MARGEVEGDEAVARLLTTLATGAGAGAALGALATGAGMAKRQFVDRWRGNVAEVRSLRSEVRGLKADLTAAKANGDELAAQQVEARLADVTPIYRAKQNQLLGRIFIKAVGAGIGMTLGDVTGGGALGFLLAPTAAKGLKRLVTPGVTKAVGGAQRAVAPWARRVGDAIEDALVAPDVRARVTAGIKQHGETIAETIGGGARRLIDRLPQPGAESRLGRILRGPESLGEQVGAGVTDMTESALNRLARARAPRDLPLGEAAVHAAGQEVRGAVGGYISDVSRRALQEFEGAGIGQKIGSAARKGIKRVGEGVESGLGRLGVVAEDMAPLVAEVGGHAVGAGAGAAAVGESVLGGAAAGGVEGAIIGLAAHAAGKEAIRGAGRLLTEKLAPAARAGALELLAPTDWAEIVEELPEVDAASLEAHTLVEMPTNLPQPLQASISGQVLGALAYLQQSHPGPKAGGPDTPEGRGYLRRLQTVADPETLVREAAAGRLSPEHVEVWERVYPRMLEQLRATVRAEMEAARAAGGEYTDQQAAQLSTLLGDKSIAPRLYDPAAVQRLQQMHQQAREAGKSGPKPRPRNITGMSDAAMTASQRIAG